MTSHTSGAGTFTIGTWRVDRVGYGAMQLAGDNVFGPPRDRDEALRVLQSAVEAGVNHIDTAHYYGPGVVNELIREALHPYPTDLAIVSKVAARRDDRGAVLPYDDPDQLRAGIEDNLTALDTDHLAAVNLRLMDDAQPGPRFDLQLSAMIRARDEGLIDGVGLSNITLGHLRRALDQTEIVCVQNLMNIADQRAHDVIAECQARGIAFVPYCPLGWPRGAQNQILANPVLGAIAATLDATPAQVALAWLLDLAPNILLIPGTRTRAHLIENMRAGTVRLDDATRSVLEREFPAQGLRA
jgi:pyridoxine 4-dehydrogenase